MNWACGRCGTVHTQNPSACRNCGGTAFRPVRDTDLPNTGSQGPEAVEMEQTQTYGTTPEPEYDSSPDVAVDGSVDVPEQPRKNTLTQQESRFRNWLQWGRQKFGATLRAPMGLFRELLLPILAFVLVIVAV